MSKSSRALVMEGYAVRVTRSSIHSSPSFPEAQAEPEHAPQVAICGESAASLYISAIFVRDHVCIVGKPSEYTFSHPSAFRKGAL